MATLSAVWDRLPLPAEHAVGMLGGLAAQRLSPARRLPATLVRTGWLLVAAGAGLNAWAVAARHGAAIERPEHLVTDGPQTITRNPMYVGWSLLHLGSGLVIRSPWVLATWLPAFALLHRAVLHEERELAARFGPAFSEYRGRVPRYVRLRPPGT